MMDNFWNGFQKEAFMQAEDVADRLGIYLDGKSMAMAEDLIEKEKAKSFALRHPILTGIPTLGILPAIAENAAMRRIEHKIMADPKVRSAVEESIEKEHRREAELMPLRMEERKREAQEAMAREGLRTLGGLGSEYMTRKYPSQED
jgi:hypothetical protein